MHTEIELLMLSPQETAEVADGTAGPAIRGYRWSAPEVLPPFVAAIQLQRLQAGEDWYWCAGRVFVDPQAGQAVGSGTFKTSPDAGTLEIGYGVAAPFTGRGCATRGVSLLLAEAFARPEIQAVTAETSVDNSASIRVLEKNGFVPTGRREDPEDGLLICWRLQKP
jgi:RimJ/RimL family protein N-acetyltransferase